jgi:hypothetical protein
MTTPDADHSLCPHTTVAGGSTCLVDVPDAPRPPAATGEG